MAKTLCGRIELALSWADPDGGRGLDPPPWKVTISIGLYRNKQMDPNPGKSC